MSIPGEGDTLTLVAKSSKKKLPKKAASIEALTAFMHCKGGPMRDRRLRRPKERENDWKREED